jgi:hypothetical protein
MATKKPLCSKAPRFHEYDPDGCDLDYAQYLAESARTQTSMQERDQQRRSAHAADLAVQPVGGN